MQIFRDDIIERYQAMQEMKHKGFIQQYFNDSVYAGRTVSVNGKKLLNFISCSYLGLETDPILKEGAIKAAQEFGTQLACSRTILSNPLYMELEDLLSQIFPGYQVVTTTTTLAHCSALPLFIGEKDAIILDGYVHNSVRMAAQLCKANGTFIMVTRHNDMAFLDYMVQKLIKEGYRNIWYCADGIYSLQGDKLDVSGLINLLNKYGNFYAYVDDAHGGSWTGKNGSGYVLGHYRQHEKMVVAISFCKSFSGGGGALILPNEEWAKVIRSLGQTMMFSGPIQPPTLGTLVASAKLHLSEAIIELQAELLELILHFRSRCEVLGIPLFSKDETPIQIIEIGDEAKTISIMEQLINNGFFLTAALPPSVAKGNEGIRITITRHVNKSDISSLLDNIKTIL
ncbi:aminotransferase class I/II-fold pyridoxal phosphate-dependent enzyme [candidate division KSB1 bacterium]|nr:aminotransferase class I/II-fold pyridoxal phosphate-dependent enzyme [candidate division KSB1 bacterium]